MSYILCVPDVRFADYEHCEHINQVMERLKNRNVVEIESEPTLYKVYSGPDNCRKYRIHLNNSDSLSEIRRKQKLVRTAGESEAERDAMEYCRYYFGDTGRLTAFYKYIDILEQEQQQTKIMGAVLREMAA